VDGIPNVTARRYGLSVTMPMSDAVEEFKVTTTMFDASLGRSKRRRDVRDDALGQQPAGRLGLLLRADPSLNANSWQNNKAGIPRPSSSSYNLMGATLGGPIQKDKTFFFVAVERISQESDFTRQGRSPRRPSATATSPRPSTAAASRSTSTTPARAPPARRSPATSSPPASSTRRAGRSSLSTAAEPAHAGG